MSDKMREARKVLDSEVYDDLNATVSETEREAVMKQLREQQSPVTAGAIITDAMCEAAMKADAIDRIQGFTYDKRHVIRDVYMPHDQQEIWSAPVGGADEYQAFQQQCRIENMRMVLTAALSLSPPQSRPVSVPAAPTCSDPNCSDPNCNYDNEPAPSPTAAGREDEDHPDCTTDRERELYDALMGLASHATANYPNYRKWSQGGLVLAPVVARALRLEGSELTPQDGGGK